MRQAKIIMGMPVTVEVTDQKATVRTFEQVFKYFRGVDQRFSTYKESSEISRINRGEIQPSDYSPPMKEILQLAEQTRRQSDGYFDIGPVGHCDPSGVVKGWAIGEAANILARQGWENFYVEAGGDIQTRGYNSRGEKWRVGIRNPFNLGQNVKVIELGDGAIATSGTYERGQHIYNPKNAWRKEGEIVSLTVIGSNILDADRFATAAFAMGRQGIAFIETLPELEGYMIDANGKATMTSGFEQYVLTPVKTMR